MYDYFAYMCPCTMSVQYPQRSVKAGGSPRTGSILLVALRELGTETRSSVKLLVAEPPLQPSMLGAGSSEEGWIARAVLSCWA